MMLSGWPTCSVHPPYILTHIPLYLNVPFFLCPHQWILTFSRGLILSITISFLPIYARVSSYPLLSKISTLSRPLWNGLDTPSLFVKIFMTPCKIILMAWFWTLCTGHIEGIFRFSSVFCQRFCQKVTKKWRKLTWPKTKFRLNVASALRMRT